MVTVATDVIKVIIDASFKGAAQVKQAEKAINRIDKAAKGMDKSIQNSALGFRAIQGVLLGAGLSFLFTGMAIKRFFEGILRSLFQVFLMVEGQTGPVNEALNEMKARLFFLAFALIDAFVQTGVLDIWIDRLERIVNWFISLDDGAKAFIVNFSVWGAIIGTVLMVVGQTMLAFLGILTVIDFIMKLGFLKWLKTIGATLASGGVLGILSLLAGLFAIFILLPKLIDRFGGFFNFVKAVFAGLAKASLLFGSFLVNGIIVVLEMLLAAAAKILPFLPGGGGLVGAVSTAAFALEKGRRGLQGSIVGGLEAIDVGTGADEIRREMTINNNITIEGNADADALDKLLIEIEKRIGFSQGSPQQ